MSYQNHESQIPDVENKLEEASRQKDRKRVKLLLNNLWHQVKGDLVKLSDGTRRHICDLFDRYGESNHFKVISEKIWYGDDPSPKRVVESIQSASVEKDKNGKIRVVWGDRMVHRRDGSVEVDNV